MNYTLYQIQEVLNAKNYVFFDTVNIVGIRTSNIIANSFDDWLYLIYEGDKIQSFPITTDPGAYWLENPMNVRGTAILVPGQYLDSHAIGLHQGKYEALKQQKPLKVWRDNTKDHIIDTSEEIYEGIYGINIHRSNPHTQSKVVEKWSAGCQVFKKVADFNFFMEVCKSSGEQTFTYTLLEESDFQRLSFS